MKHELELMQLALEAAENEAKEVVRKIRESKKMLEAAETDLAMHNDDDLNSAIMKVKFASALPHGTPGIFGVTKASQNLIEALAKNVSA